MRPESTPSLSVRWPLQRRQNVRREGGLYRRASGAKIQRVDEFASMSDEELRQYVYGNKVQTVRPCWRAIRSLFRLMGRDTALLV